MTTTTRTLPAYTVPALDHDAMMAAQYQHTLTTRHRVERRIVAALGAYLAQYGFRPSAVWDGEERTEVDSIKAAMELIFNLDAAHLYFKDAGRPRGREHWVFFVLGNDDGTAVIADYGYYAGDPDGFDAAMGWFTVEGIDAIVAAL